MAEELPSDRRRVKRTTDVSSKNRVDTSPGRAAFRARLEYPPGSPTLTFVRVPVDVRAVFGRARAPVRVTVGDYTYRSTVSIYDGEAFLPVRRSHREAAGLRAGDAVDVVVALDTAPRGVRAPAALAAALKKHAKARAAWQKLSVSHKREHADAVAGAKKPETRARRVAAAITKMLEKRK